MKWSLDPDSTAPRFLLTAILCAPAVLAADVILDGQQLYVPDMASAVEADPVCIATDGKLVANCDLTRSDFIREELCRLYLLGLHPLPDYCPARTVFVTHESFDGNLGGVAGADAKCQLAADGASLPGTYMAWIATSHSDEPAARFSPPTAGPIVLPDRTIVARDWDHLTLATAVSLVRPIGVTELGSSAGDSTYVWTNVDATGTAVITDDVDGTCNGFASSADSQSAVFGSLEVTNQNWSDSGFTAPCNFPLHLYCFQQ